MKLKSILNKLAELIDVNIPYHSHGGCGVIALAVAKQLGEYGIEPRFRIVSDSYNDDDDNDEEPYMVVNIDQIRDNIRFNGMSTKSKDAWNDHNLHFTHVILEFDWRGRTYQWEVNDGIILAEKAPDRWNGWPIAEGYMTVEEFEPLVKERDGWNPRYNRNQNPRVTQLIQEAFAAG